MKKRTKKEKHVIYVAVVVKATLPLAHIAGFPSILSARPEGDWACFVATDRKAAAEKALQATRKWGLASYKVLVGTLTALAQEPTKFDLVPIRVKAA